MGRREGGAGGGVGEGWKVRKEGEGSDWMRGSEREKQNECCFCVGRGTGREMEEEEEEDEGGSSRGERGKRGMGSTTNSFVTIGQKKRRKRRRAGR